MWKLRADVPTLPTHLGLETILLPSFSLHKAVCEEIQKGIEAKQEAAGTEGAGSVAACHSQARGSKPSTTRYAGRSFAKRFKMRKLCKTAKRTDVTRRARQPTNKKKPQGSAKKRAVTSPSLCCAVESWSVCSFQAVAAVRLVIKEAKWPTVTNTLPPALVQMLQQLFDSKVPHEGLTTKQGKPLKQLPPPTPCSLWVPYPLLPYVLDKLKEKTAEECANVTVAKTSPCLCCRRDPGVAQSRYAMSKEMCENEREKSLCQKLAVEATTATATVMTEAFAAHTAQRGPLKSLCQKLHHAYEGGAYPTLRRPTLLASERRVAVSSANVAPHQVVMDHILASQMAIYQELHPNTDQINRAREDLCQVKATRRSSKLLWIRGTRQGSWVLPSKVLKDTTAWSGWCMRKLQGSPSLRMWYQRPLVTGDLILVKRSPENASVAPLVLEAKVGSVPLPMNNVGIHAATMASLALQGDFDGDQLVLSSMSLDPLSRDLGFVLAAADFGGCRLRKLPGLYAASASLLLEPLTSLTLATPTGWTHLHELLEKEAIAQILNREERSLYGQSNRSREQLGPKERRTKAESHVQQKVLPLLNPLLKAGVWPGSAGTLYSLWEQAFGPWAAQSLWARIDRQSHALATSMPPVSVMSLLGLSPGREWLVRFVQYIGYKVAQQAPPMYQAELAQHVGEVATACARLRAKEACVLASTMIPCLRQDYETDSKDTPAEPHPSVMHLLTSLRDAPTDLECYNGTHRLLESIQRLRIAHRGLLGFPVNVNKGTIGWKEGDTTPYGPVSNTNIEAMWTMLGAHFTHRGDVGRRFMRQITADVRRLIALRQHPVLGCYMAEDVVVGTLEAVNAYRGLPLPKQSVHHPNNFVHVPLACDSLDGPFKASCVEDMTCLTDDTRAYYWSGLQHQGLAFVSNLTPLVEIWRSTKQPCTDYREVWVVYLTKVPEWLPEFNTVLIDVLGQHPVFQCKLHPAYLVVCTMVAKPSAGGIVYWKDRALPCGCLSLQHDERMVLFGKVSETWASQLNHFGLRLAVTQSALVPVTDDRAAVYYHNGTAGIILKLESETSLSQSHHQSASKKRALHDLGNYLDRLLLRPMSMAWMSPHARPMESLPNVIGEWSFKFVSLGAIFGICLRLDHQYPTPLRYLIQPMEEATDFPERSLEDILNLDRYDFSQNGHRWGASHAAAWSLGAETTITCPRCNTLLRPRLRRENAVAGSSKADACFLCEDHTSTSLPRAVRHTILEKLQQFNQPPRKDGAESDVGAWPAMVVLGFDLDQSQLQPKEVLQLAGLLSTLAPALVIEPLIIADGLCFFLCLGQSEMLRNDLLTHLHTQGHGLRLCPPSLWSLPIWSQCRTAAISSHHLLLEGTANYKATPTHKSAVDVAQELTREARKRNMTVPGSNAGKALTLPEKMVNGDVLGMPLYDVLALALVQKRTDMQLGVAMRIGKDTAVQRSLQKVVEQTRKEKTKTYTKGGLLGPKGTWRARPIRTISAKPNAIKATAPTSDSSSLMVGIFQRERLGLMLQTMAWPPSFGLCMRGQLFVICELLRHNLCPLEIQDHPDLKPIAAENRLVEWTSQRLSAALGIHHLGTLSLGSPMKECAPFVATSRALVVAAVLLMLQRQCPHKYQNNTSALIKAGQLCFMQWLTREMTPTEQALLPSMCVAASRHKLILPPECLRTLVLDVGPSPHKRKAICLDE